MFIDTHTHLYSDQFDQDRASCIDNALKLGVTKFLLPAIDSTYTDAMLDLVAKYPDNMIPMTGLHPTHVKSDNVFELQHIKNNLKTGIYRAVGEIGVDLYWDKTYRRSQLEVFAQQIDWAINYDLPIVIHAREAFDDIFSVLEQFKTKNLKGVCHCFTGNLEQAQVFIDYGFLLGIGGVVTFKNGEIDKFLNQIPLEYVLLETDAPYLAPSPHRGKRNESAYLPLIAQKISETYQLPVEEIARVTTFNAKKLFKID